MISIKKKASTGKYSCLKSMLRQNNHRRQEWEKNCDSYDTTKNIVWPPSEQ